LAALSLTAIGLCAIPGSAQASGLPCTVRWGAYVTSAPWDDTMTDLRNLDTQLNRHTQTIHWYAQWGNPGPGVFSYNEPRLLNNVHTYRSLGTTGATPFITWEPWGPNYTAASQDFPLSAIAAGTFDAYIDSWATGLAGVGYPVLLDFAHEMNGTWYPWGYGVNGNTPDQYVAAFRHVHDRFALAGAFNVKFVWNTDYWTPSGLNASAWYPGDAYVDWMAIDVYNWNTAWATPYALIQGIYGQVAALNPSKPMMLAEVASGAYPPAGSSPSTQADWITALASTIPQSFPRIRRVVWFNELNTEFALTNSPATLAAAQNAFGGC
jgi:beta-mannanase